MTKLNIKELPGYKDDMTAEEKLALLEAYEIPEPDYTGYIAKSIFDKTASDLAEAKKRIKEKMTADEQADAEREAAEKALRERLETLERDKAVSERTAYYLSRKGYDETLAKEAANAFVTGETEKLNAAEKKAEVNYEKALRAELLRGTPGPDGNGGGDNSGDGLTPSQTLAKSIAAKVAENATATKATLDFYTKTE